MLPHSLQVPFVSPLGITHIGVATGQPALVVQPELAGGVPDGGEPDGGEPDGGDPDGGVPDGLGEGVLLC